MSTVITVPASLDDTTFETMLHDVAALPDDAKLVIDARYARFASPYGLIGMLTLAQSRTVAPEFIPPEDLNTSSYWARAGFFEHAKELMELRGTAPKSRKTGDSSSLLDVTRIARTEDERGRRFRDDDVVRADRTRIVDRGHEHRPRGAHHVIDVVCRDQT